MHLVWSDNNNKKSVTANDPIHHTHTHTQVAHLVRHKYVQIYVGGFCVICVSSVFELDSGVCGVLSKIQHHEHSYLSQTDVQRHTEKPQLHNWFEWRPPPSLQHSHTLTHNLWFQLIILWIRNYSLPFDWNGSLDGFHGFHGCVTMDSRSRIRAYTCNIISICSRNHEWNSIFFLPTPKRARVCNWLVLLCCPTVKLVDEKWCFATQFIQRCEWRQWGSIDTTTMSFGQADMLLY